MTPTGPCSWPWLPCSCGPLDDMATDGVEEVVAWASSLLWQATGRVFGPCPVSVLPCDDGRILCGSCHNAFRRCGCSTVPEIRLPGPVSEVTAVVVDGETLDAEDYRIDDYEWLVRLDGGTWPLNPNPIDPDRFRVDYTLGVAPPAGAGLVTGILACELAKVICNDDTCRLPRRLQSMTRQGLSVEWDGMGFGLPDVDLWVENANMPIMAGAVHSPDLSVVRQITWQAEPSPGSP